MPADIKDRILKIGKEIGCISINMLNDLIPEEKDANYIDEIFDFLAKNEIEVTSHAEFGKKKKEHDSTWTDESSDDEQKADEKVTTSKEEPQEVEETTTTYLREMGRFDLLTPEEEEKYSKIIREGFDSIIKTIHIDSSGTVEINLLVERIALWEKRDPTLKPKKQHVFILKITARVPSSKLK